jgi:hypothetical protein
VLKILDQRKQAVLHWLQNPRQANGDNWNTSGHEASRTSRKEKDGISKKKIMSLKHTVRADSHSILNRWNNYFCQLLSEHDVNDDRQT